ncbi:hypothetical protein P3S67_015694 [Capsicum chacoense]
MPIVALRIFGLKPSVEILHYARDTGHRNGVEFGWKIENTTQTLQFSLEKFGKLFIAATIPNIKQVDAWEQD